MALADGRMLKATGTGGSGANMFNLQEVDGTFLTGADPSNWSSSSARRTSICPTPLQDLFPTYIMQRARRNFKNLEAGLRTCSNRHHYKQFRQASICKE